MADLANAPAIATAPSVRQGRNLGIDLARGLAVVLMIQTHAFDGWVSHADKLSLGYRLSRVFSNIPAPLFLLLAGLSLGLQAASAERSGKDLVKVRAGMARRAIEVVGYGYLVSFVYAVLDWQFHAATLLRADILHCIGMSLLVCTYLLVGRARIVLRVMLLVVLGIGAGIALGLVPRLLTDLPLPVAALLGLVVDVAPITRFPLLPLCGFTVLGALIGMRLRPTEWSVKQHLLLALLAVAAVYPLQELTTLTVQQLGGRLSRSHPAVIWNFLEGTARALAVLTISLATAARLPERSYGWLLRLGRGSLLAYAFHIPLCYGRISQPLWNKLTMLQAAPLVMLLIALTWLAVRLRDGVTERRSPTPPVPTATAVLVLLLLLETSAQAQTPPLLTMPPPSPSSQSQDLEQAQDAELSRVADELAHSGRFALANALLPTEQYRSQVVVPPDYSIQREVERCHVRFAASQFRESSDCYALMFAARPELLRVLFNIAQGLRRAGESATALAFYHRYLGADPYGPLRAEVEGYIRELSALLQARAQLGQKSPPTPPTPVYKRAWFWVTLTTGVALVTTAVVLGVTLGTRTTPPPPTEEVLGPFDVVFPH